MSRAKGENRNHCLIICNGEISKQLLSEFYKQNPEEIKTYVIAADGAANTLFKFDLIPDLITGDFDSIEPAALAYYKTKKTEIRKILDQNRNDFEKALGFALAKGYGKISVLGATGKRLDHTLNNLSILKQYHAMSDIRLYDNEFEIFYTDGKTEFNYPKGEIVSLMAMQKADKIKTKGLKHLLKNESLEFGVRQGTLNFAASDSVQIEVGKGELLVLKKHFGKLNLFPLLVK
jgi:thiamine pyrophosphokinase